MARRWATVLVACAIAVAGALVVFIALGDGGGGSGVPTRVPDVIGQRLDVAQDRLDYVGLGMELTGGGTFGIVARSRWWVCDQEPQAGVTATSVLLVVDRQCEPRLIPAPAVEDLALDVAKRRIAAAEITYSVVSLVPGRQPRIDSEWLVCDQEPPQGVATATMKLSVGLACEEPPVLPTGVVPDVRGNGLRTARATLTRAGISIDVYTPGGTDPVVEAGWTVCDQWSVPELEYVQLFVSRSACWKDWRTP